MTITMIHVKRKDIRESVVVEAAPQALGAGQIRVRVQKFALTANNISYALTGDMIGYWKFYPVDETWGIVPVWGFGEVIESTAPDFAVGERIYGFWPMGTEAVLTPGQVTAGGFMDETPHRQSLPYIYNRYDRLRADSAANADLEDERALLFPLFATSYLLDDYLIDNAYFGAEQVVIGSVSSKTGFGLAHLLKARPAPRPRIIGLTSPGNVAFVQRLNCCDQILTYDQITDIPMAPTAFVDMAGNGAVIAAIDEHLGEHVKLSSIVGATHWDQKRFRGTARGAQPAMFFAPAQIAKREQEWPAGEVIRRAQAASFAVARAVKPHLRIAFSQGSAPAQAAYARMVGGQTPPDEGVMISLWPPG